jgi:hypothetical protein
MHRALLFVAALLATSSVRADDSAVRQMLQSKYATAKALSGIADPHLKSLDIRGRPVSPNYPTGAKFTVESADTLDRTAMASVMVSFLRGSERIIRHELHIWVVDGGAWKLRETRVTSFEIEKNGKLLSAERDAVPTDWQKSYGRDATWKNPRRPSGPNGPRS